MNEEYLWDKSGEPDPEIQQLEEILGTLCYQPKPLEIPNETPVIRNRHRYLPWLAIAAMVLLALLAGIVGLSFRSKGLENNREAFGSAPIGPTNATNPQIATPVKKENLNANGFASPQHRRKFAAVNRPRKTVEPVADKEALVAKEQLMAALRLASEKLNLAQRKAQSPAPTQIRNQHKIG